MHVRPMLERTLTVGRHRHGVNPVELLVVVAIIGILIALLSPVALASEKPGVTVGKPNPDFRIMRLPGDPVPLPTDGFSVRQINGLWHEGTYYVYADVIDWTNPYHPDSYSSSIGAYSSPDGVDWKYHGKILSPGAEGQWDHGGVATPGAVKFQDKFYVAYSGRELANGGGERFIGLAVAYTPLGPFAKMPPIASKTGHPNCQPCFDDPQLVTRPGEDKIYLYYRYARRPEGSSTGGFDYSIRLQTTTDPEQGWSDPQTIIRPHPDGMDKIETEDAKWIDGQFVMMVIEYGMTGGAHRIYVSADGVDYQPATLPSLSRHAPGLYRPNPAASLSGLLVDGRGKLRFVNTVGFTDSKGHFTAWICPVETARQQRGLSAAVPNRPEKKEMP